MQIAIRLATMEDVPALKVTDRFDIPMADGATLPCAHMKKDLL
jgi:hypothetical protein